MRAVKLIPSLLKQARSSYSIIGASMLKQFCIGANLPPVMTRCMNEKNLTHLIPLYWHSVTYTLCVCVITEMVLIYYHIASVFEPLVSGLSSVCSSNCSLFWKTVFSSKTWFGSCALRSCCWWSHAAGLYFVIYYVDIRESLLRLDYTVCGTHSNWVMAAHFLLILVFLYGHLLIASVLPYLLCPSPSFATHLCPKFFPLVFNALDKQRWVGKVDLIFS